MVRTKKLTYVAVVFKHIRSWVRIPPRPYERIYKDTLDKIKAVFIANTVFSIMQNRISLPCEVMRQNSLFREWNLIK